MKQFNIINARPEDAPMIAEAIMTAVGEELMANMAGSHSRDDVKGIFTRLARREDTQYSYLNTRIAVLPDGTKAGYCISYDGGKLLQLRRPFFEEANKVLGWNLSEDEVDYLPPESTPDEFYLDSLATLPEYRGRGIASALIRDAAVKAKAASLPLGLLVADDNPQARKLYESLGFRPAARRPFAGEMMTDMRLELDHN